LRKSLTCLEQGATWTTTGPPLEHSKECMLHFLAVHHRAGDHHGLPHVSSKRRLNSICEDSGLRPVVDQAFPLAAVHLHTEQAGQCGKRVLRMV
jgi:hypothetical protein